MYIKIGSQKLFVEIIDKKKTTPLFLLPGGPGFDHMVYKINQPDFENFFTVVYHDPRGCGQSQGFKIDTFTLDYNIEDIESIRSSLGMKKIMMLGHSYGSMVAMGYAIRYPQYVSKLILSAGAPESAFLKKARENLLAKGTKEQQELGNQLLWPGAFSSQAQANSFFKIMRSLYSKKVARNPELANYVNPLIECRYEPLNVAFKNKFWDFNFLNDLSKITCETKILFGRDDWINDPIFAKKILANIKNASLQYFDAGHALSYDCYEAYFETCLEFLRD